MTGEGGQALPGNPHPSPPSPQPRLPEDSQLIRAAMNAAPDGILLVDRTGRILMANSAMEAISGYAAQELCGSSVNIFLPAALRDSHARHVEA